MKFIIEPAVFEKLPTACFGVVAAKGVDNSRRYEKIDALLDAGIALAALAEELFGCPVRTGFLDRDCQEMDLSF